jgi:hypothetical protein
LYFSNPALLQRSQLAPPVARVAIENGVEIAQRPLSRTPRVLSHPETVVAAIAAVVPATPPKAGRKKKAQVEPEQLPLEGAAGEAAYPV